MASTAGRPRLLFFSSPQDGRGRRVESYLAQVLQRRRNHETFQIQRIDVQARPELAERFKIDGIPTLMVVDGRRVAGRLTAPRSAKELEGLLGPWLH
jgi:thioredoxin-like negative regulator of GroEL